MPTSKMSSKQPSIENTRFTRSLNKSFSKVGDIIHSFKDDEDKYVSHEFQKYGYELAKELNDLKNKSLYIKLAKETPRELLENARNFVKDAYQVKSKPRLFMWRLKQLRNEHKVRKARSTKS